MHKLFLQRSCYWRLYKSNCFTCGGRYNTMLYQHFVSILNQSATYTEYHFRSNSNSNSNVKSNANQFNPNPRGLDIHIDSNSTQTSDNTNQDSTSYQVRSNFARNSNAVLLGTAVIQIFHMGKFFTARALIDSGSEGTFISERLFKALKIPAQTTSAQISGLNNGVSARCNKTCSLVLSSRYDSTLRIKAKAFVIPQVTGKLPSCSQFRQLLLLLLVLNPLWN